MKLKLPQPPYPLRAGMEWSLDGDCVHVFDGGEPVMSISIAEITSEVAKIRTTQQRTRAAARARAATLDHGENTQ